MVGQVAQEQVRASGGQLVLGMDAGSDRDGSSTDSPGTPNVQRGISDDPNTVVGDVRTDVSMNRSQCLASHVVAVEMVVPEAAEGEVLEDPEMPQFRLGTGTHVAGEQTENRAAARLQPLQDFLDAGKDPSLVAVEAIGQAAKVAGEDALQVIRSLLDTVVAKQIPEDGPIGASAVGDMHLQFDAEILGQGRFEGRLACPAGGEQGPVDIEQADVHTDMI